MINDSMSFPTPHLPDVGVRQEPDKIDLTDIYLFAVSLFLCGLCIVGLFAFAVFCIIESCELAFCNPPPPSSHEEDNHHHHHHDVSPTQNLSQLSTV